MDIIEIESPNFSSRSSLINAIIIHDTGGKTAKGALTWMINPVSDVSSHYLIGKDGSVYRLVDDDNKAWHAGKSILYGEENVNDFSIGIELVDDNDGDLYPDEQMDSLFTLCTQLCDDYRIPLNRVVGHVDVCIPKGRKVDPGKDFPWYEFLMTLGAKIAEKDLKDD